MGIAMTREINVEEVAVNSDRKRANLVSSEMKACAIIQGSTKIIGEVKAHRKKAITSARSVKDVTLKVSTFMPHKLLNNGVRGI